MVPRVLLTVGKGITVADLPDRIALRNRISARLFGGASGGVFRGMVALASGSAFAKLITIGAVPVLTRLYTPDDLGTLALFTGLISILAPIVTMQYYMAIPLPKRGAQVINLMLMIILLIFVMVIFISLLLEWGMMLLPQGDDFQKLAGYRWLVPLGLVATALYSLLKMWAIRQKNYKLTAVTQVTQSLSGNAIKISLGALLVGPLGLFVGTIAAQLIGALQIFHRYFSTLAELKRFVSVRRMSAQAKRYAGYPAFRLPSHIILNLATKGPALLIVAIFGLDVGGQFALAAMILLAPADLISKTMSKAFYGEIAQLSGRCTLILPVFKRVVVFTFGLGFVAAIVIILFATFFFELVFGQQWSQAGQFISIMSFALVTVLPMSSVNTLLNVVGGQLYFLMMNIIRLLVVYSAFAIAVALQFNPAETIVTYTLARAIFSVGVLSFYWVLLTKRGN